MAALKPYDEYLERLEELGVARKRLGPEAFERMMCEYDRLIERVDPEDVQLDEWKRLEELRFLLVLADEEDDDS